MIEWKNLAVRIWPNPRYQNMQLGHKITWEVENPADARQRHSLKRFPTSLGIYFAKIQSYNFVSVG